MYFKLLTFAMILICLTTNVTSSSCGSGKFQNFMAKLFITLDCPGRLSQFNSCCDSHDSCYDQQLGRGNCDNDFCGCVKQAGKGTLCELDGRKFCDWVVQYGQKAYNNAARKIMFL
uniref:Uncharacterized protein n=1 Tax=Panagrolaimus superbus TaxID=310955 RepID=A0A914Z3H9_9BILA